ncbi:MAG: FHA domain-containing protein [Eubacterium sp.]|nr:FHA domain-containing protein [Eubacterium sp.]
MPELNTRETMQVTRSLALSSEVAGGLICIRGNHIGHMIPLPGDKTVVFGRDPAVCQVVLDDGQVSRKHCQITYIASLMQYRIMDLSKNGTFFGDGTRLKQGKEYYVKPAAEIYMGNGDNLYKFR